MMKKSSVRVIEYKTLPELRSEVASLHAANDRLLQKIVEQGLTIRHLEARLKTTEEKSVKK